MSINDQNYPDASIPEDQLILLAGTGDNQAFSLLYERYVTKIFNYIYYRTGNTTEAEDLTERVFYRALGHISNYRNMGLPFSAWLYRIAHNLVANWHRDNARRKEYPLEDHINLPFHGDHPEVSMIKTQEKDKLLSIIRELPEERQIVVILKFVEHLSNSEIAVIMNRSEGAIKSLYHRTLMQLRNDIASASENEGGE